MLYCLHSMSIAIRLRHRNNGSWENGKKNKLLQIIIKLIDRVRNRTLSQILLLYNRNEPKKSTGHLYNRDSTGSNGVSTGLYRFHCTYFFHTFLYCIGFPFDNCQVCNSFCQAPMKCIPLDHGCNCAEPNLFFVPKASPAFN